MSSAAEQVPSLTFPCAPRARTPNIDPRPTYVLLAKSSPGMEPEVTSLTTYAGDPAGSDRFLLTLPTGGPVTSNGFGHPWRRPVAAAGAPGLRYHHPRHMFASTLLSRGVSVKAVGDWLGHANPTITLTTYAH